MSDPLTPRQIRIARRVARRCYIDNPNDLEAAEQCFRSNKEIVAIDPAMIVFVIKIAWILWQWWRSRDVTIPSESWESDEPGVCDDQDD